MKAWVAKLHGGQLTMLLLFVAAVGLVATWLGFQGFLLPSNRSYELAHYLEDGSPLRSIAKDTAAAAVLTAQARTQGDIRLWLIGSGLVVWGLTIPLLWWWFGARRRTDSGSTA